jgi:CubicO group peptidase (beta-lactamase class C family)
MTFTTSRRSFLALSGLAGAGLAAPVWGKSRGVSALSPALQAVLDRWVADKHVPGAVASMARGLDQAVFMMAGTQSFDDAAAMTPDSLFRAYSMTKPLTGMAAMILIGEGRLGMDQNIADILPAFANPRVMTDPEHSLASRPAKSPITVRSLLTHTAGLGYTITSKGPLLDAYLKNGLYAAQASRAPLEGMPSIPHPTSLADFADRLAALPLIADPGTMWSYSLSLDLLGRVIEVVAGMPFETFLQSRIFKPLGMTGSYFQVPGMAAKRLTTNYVLKDGKPLPLDPARDSIYLDKPPCTYGGAGLVTSPRDWDRFLLMLAGEGALGRTRIMSRETARWAMSNLLHPDTKVGGWLTGQGFGAGGRVVLNAVPGGESVGSFGWGGAASTTGWVDRTKGVRATGWVQLMTMNAPQLFPIDIAKAVYSS